MTDTPPTAFEVPHSTRGLHSAALNWRHRAFIIAYARLGFDNPAQAAVDAGVANGVKHGEKIARGYLALPAVQEAIRNTLRTSGIGEGVIRAVVQKWLWHDDPNASLRAAELGARILGMLREPAPAVPQLPPLIVLQAAPPQQVSVPAEYTVESAAARFALRPKDGADLVGEPRQNDVDNPPVSDTARAALISIPRHVPACEGHNELWPLISVSEKAPETPPKAPRTRKPVKSRTPKAKSAKAKRPTKADR